jgi:hypothetical protein
MVRASCAQNTREHLAAVQAIVAAFRRNDMDAVACTTLGAKAPWQ